MRLRNSFLLYLPIHLGLVCSDLYVYKLEVAPVVFDVAMAYFCFYNYMLLYKLTTIIQLILYLIAIVCALTHIQRMVTGITEWVPVAVFFV